MRLIRLLGLAGPRFCKLHAGFAESIIRLEKGLLRISHPFRPPGTSRVKMPFALVYPPPIDGKCRHALSILVSPHSCRRPDQMTPTEHAACARTALTQLNGHSQRCANPSCDAVVKIKSPRGKHGRYCSTDCRMDGYALRRAKALLAKVGIIRFHTLLDRV
jgi:hypothetical protein